MGKTNGKKTPIDKIRAELAKRAITGGYISKVNSLIKAKKDLNKINDN